MNLKSLMLGTAATTFAFTGAMAADLPAQPEPIDYVRVCDVHGTGFFYLPGTETCLRVGGDVRARYAYNSVEHRARDESPSEFSARGRVFLDARTESEWGTIRTFIRYSGTSDQAGEDREVELDRAFIQVGNFVAGYASSFLNMTYGAYAINNVWGTFDSDETTWLAGYTFDFGNGVYLAASVEAPERAGIVDFFTDDAYGGVTWPDAGAQFGINQAWGSASVVAGIHQVRPVYQGVDSEIGWFVGAGAEFNVGSSTKIGGSAFYTDGAVARLGLDDLDFFDASINSNGKIDTSTGYSATLGLSHSFTSEIAFNLNGSYFRAENDLDGSDLKLEGFMIGSSVDYEPVSGLTFSVGAEYIDAEISDNVDSDQDDAYAITLQVVRSF